MTEPFDGPIARGQVDYYSERFGGKPYNNCMPCSLMTPLRFMGYVVEDGFDDVIREASGVPEYFDSGKPRGMGLADLKRATDALFPGAPIFYGALADADIKASLKRYGLRGKNKATFVIMLHMDMLPPHLRRWAGQNYDGGHAATLISKLDWDGEQVYMYDVMQPVDPPADAPDDWQPGEAVAWTDIEPALFRNRSGKVQVAYAYKNTAVPVE